MPVEYSTQRAVDASPGVQCDHYGLRLFSRCQLARSKRENADQTHPQFGGRVLTLGELAAAEQVRPPTITRLVAALEADQLVARTPDPTDARVTRISATAKGERLLHEGRLRRVAALAEAMRKLSPRERALVAAALPILERLARGS